MKHDELYHQWVRLRRDVEVSRDFSGRVSSHIRRRQRRKAGAVVGSPNLILHIGASSWRRAAAIAVAAVIGLGRLLLTLHILLSV